MSTICIASPRSSDNTFRNPILIAPFHSSSPAISLRVLYAAPRAIYTLLYLRLKRHGFNGIIAYWGGNVKGFEKNNRPVFAGSKKAFSKTAHDAPIKTTRQTDQAICRILMQLSCRTACFTAAQFYLTPLRRY